MTRLYPFVWLVALCAIACGGAEKSGPDNGLPAGCDPIDPTYEGYAQAFFSGHCTACHAASLEGEARLGALVGVDFDSAADIAHWQHRIAARAVEERSMPPGVPLSDCAAAQLASYLDTLNGQGACVPICDGKRCGDNGCGGICGICALDELCSESGMCVDSGCTPMCEGIACGDDGCYRRQRAICLPITEPRWRYAAVGRSP